MRVAGVMSGTSLDGIDVAVVEIDGRRRIRTIAARSTRYPRSVRDRILAVSDTTTTTGAISRLNFELGELYARAVRGVGVPIKTIQLIGCHGQTIYHESGRNTLQIGEAALIAERTGIPVVSDFRPRDIAAGGKGAPLVPYVDCLLFPKGSVAVNIGGIANITDVSTGVAFDTGPGNMVIDALAAEYSKGKLTCDRGGRIAARSRVDRELLGDLLRDPYYSRRPPKTAGREQYGATFVEQLRSKGCSLPDLIATATALTPISIALGVRRFAGDAKRLIVSGGGVHNPLIMGMLAASAPRLEVQTTAEYGIDPDAKEAIAFAVLAYETWRRRPSNLPSATGARHPVILGTITP